MALTNSPFQWYEKPILHFNTDVFLNNTLKVILCTSAYIPDVVNHEYYDVSITNELPTLNGYTLGGNTLTTKTAPQVVGLQYRCLSDNVIWTASGGSLTARYWVLYDDTPASNKPLLGYSWLDYNSGSPQDVVVADTKILTLAVNINGWILPTGINGVA